MTTSTFGSRLRGLRRTSAAVTLVMLVPLFGGCVSAVDETSAFGFNGAKQAAAEDAADNPADAAKPTDAAAMAAATPAEGDAAPDEKTAEAAPADDSAADGDDKPLAAGRTTIAAYAGGTINASAPDPDRKAVREADSTLFASLFTQSQAKTPIRNAETGKSRRVILQHEGAPTPADPGGPALPGVKTNMSLFEIGQKASADYDAEILEEANGEEGSYEVASLGGMARLAPNGLRVQRPDVETSCFEPKLVSMIRAVEARFGAKVVVTSGYRSPSHNRAVNGAKRSMHMACKAADIQIPGADKLAVANYVRNLPGRGGVGTYCHTTSIHIDIGPQRDWNWACRRRQT
ncbi:MULTISPECIES: YcbK family protein [unclassified Aureimonas]|uniref:YcbK family protein n=1 Tax=unclassified Aureimonas TaxID=2615206 RepID=UPI0006F5E61F|nr:MULTISPECIES: D-Ala-D-Ala carboxypeptidase family metallohydrolase [unclassified Aureimonas]KQT57465.1 hypothetical protein ASG62_09095 [Aureimonas sp. Leaf427]KQT77144.1 hypothetical protein ASG54_12960 [Aureimonas sp. Leaf460]